MTKSWGISANYGLFRSFKIVEDKTVFVLDDCMNYESIYFIPAIISAFQRMFHNCLHQNGLKTYYWFMKTDQGVCSGQRFEKFTDGPMLWTDRFICGKESVSRASLFCREINCLLFESGFGKVYEYLKTNTFSVSGLLIEWPEKNSFGSTQAADMVQKIRKGTAMGKLTRSKVWGRQIKKGSSVQVQS